MNVLSTRLNFSVEESIRFILPRKTQPVHTGPTHRLPQAKTTSRLDKTTSHFNSPSEFPSPPAKFQKYSELAIPSPTMSFPHLLRRGRERS